MYRALSLSVALGCASVQPAVIEPSAPPVDTGRGVRLTWSAVACFAGAPWNEALGALGEERTLATDKHCRTLAAEALRVEDAQTVAALRGLDRDAVDAVAEAVDAAGGDDLVVRMTAAAAREALAARRAADQLRNGEAIVNTLASDLGAKTALSRLYLHGGPSRVVALIFAGDRLETARELAPAAKVHAAAPTFDVIFGVTGDGSEFVAGDWLSLVTAAATAAKHPAPTEGSTHARARAAFIGVAEGLADRLDAEVDKLKAAGASGASAASDARDAADGYRRRLRAEIAAARGKPAT